MASNGISVESQNYGKVSATGKTNTWENPSDTAFTLALERLAKSLRQWLNDRLEEELTQERRTINVRVEQESDAKATQLAMKKLKASHKWVVTEQKRLQLLEQRGNQIHLLVNILVDALIRSTKSIAILSLFALVIAGWAWIGGMNTPSIIACRNITGLCYQARWRSPKLIVPKPEQTRCMDTPDGLVCLFPHQQMPTKKPHSTKKLKK